jgi:hypothetical protein
MAILMLSITLILLLMRVMKTKRVSGSDIYFGDDVFD